MEKVTFLLPLAFVVAMAATVADAKKGKNQPSSAHNTVHYEFHPDLSEDFYAKSCPGALEAVSEVVSEFIPEDDDLPTDLVRLHFHDCFVWGCQASALIQSTGNNLPQMNAPPNKNSLEGFEVIERAKSEVEKMCPVVVCCADVVVLAARDSLLLVSFRKSRLILHLRR
ncbi:hypothetical protein Mapa_010919 [Marchantia paleacea]|nr:hypothetical protein Mapa_010919 [Marchantia paleacea]